MAKQSLIIWSFCLLEALLEAISLFCKWGKYCICEYHPCAQNVSPLPPSYTTRGMCSPVHLQSKDPTLKKNPTCAWSCSYRAIHCAYERFLEEEWRFDTPGSCLRKVVVTTALPAEHLLEFWWGMPGFWSWDNLQPNHRTAEPLKTGTFGNKKAGLTTTNLGLKRGCASR